MRIIFAIYPDTNPIEIKGMGNYIPRKGELIATQESLFIVDEIMWKPTFQEVHVALIPVKESE